MTKLGTIEEDKIFSNKSHRSFSSEKDKQIKSINNENAKELPTKNISEKNPSLELLNQLDFLKIRKELFMDLKEDDENLKIFENIEKHLSAISKNKLRKVIDEIKY